MPIANLSVEDFDAAKAVFEQLKDLPRERQERVLRWISEGLGLSMVSQPTTVHVGHAAPAPLTAHAGSPAHPVAPVSDPARQDIKSFVAKKAPRTDSQFAAVVAYFYRFEAPSAQRQDTIDSKTLQEATRLASRRRIAEPRYALNNAKSAGYLDSVGRGKFAINSVGENLVAMALPGDGVAPSPQKSVRSKKSGTSNGGQRKQRKPRSAGQPSRTRPKSKK